MTRTFDVTDELRQITASGQKAVDVVFEATSGRGDANAKTRLDPDAKLTIGEIEIRARAK